MDDEDMRIFLRWQGQKGALSLLWVQKIPPVSLRKSRRLEVGRVGKGDNLKLEFDPGDQIVSRYSPYFGEDSVTL